MRAFMEVHPVVCLIFAVTAYVVIYGLMTKAPAEDPGDGLPKDWPRSWKERD